MSRRRERSVTVHEAKTHLSRLLEHVEKGEEIVIARGRKPVARLVPVARAEGGRRFGALRGQVKIDSSFFDSLPDDELNGWST